MKQPVSNSLPCRVLLFYIYAPIKEPAVVCEAQRLLCQQLGLKGRIIVSKEGINATLSGLHKDIDAYRSTYLGAKGEDLGPKPLVADIKQEDCKEGIFPRLSVRVRDEVVRADLPALGDAKARGMYLSPTELAAHLADPQHKEDFVLVDVRNTYEHELGHFKGAVCLPIRYFRDFKNVAEEFLRPYANKKLITYCTGGVRCEKASAYLRSQGFKHVYQLKGGLIAYDQQAKGQGFMGSCYVFDKRMVRAMQTEHPVIIGRCYACKAPTEHLINCAFPACHRLMLLCKDCSGTQNHCCSSVCKKKMEEKTPKPVLHG